MKTKVKSKKLNYSREIFQGVFQMTMPLIVGKPGPVNVYLFVGENVTLLDTGTAKSVKKLENALSEIGLTFDDIDQIIEHIIPNAFVMLDDDHQLPVRLSQKEFFDSITKIELLSPLTVYPAHGKEIFDLSTIIEKYRNNFDELQNRIISVLASGLDNNTVYDITCRLFPEICNSRSQIDIFLTVFDVFTHLQIFEDKGMVTFLVKEILRIKYNGNSNIC